MVNEIPIDLKLTPSAQAMWDKLNGLISGNLKPSIDLQIKNLDQLEKVNANLLTMNTTLSNLNIGKVDQLNTAFKGVSLSIRESVKELDYLQQSALAGFNLLEKVKHINVAGPGGDSQIGGISGKNATPYLGTDIFGNKTNYGISSNSGAQDQVFIDFKRQQEKRQQQDNQYLRFQHQQEEQEGARRDRDRSAINAQAKRRFFSSIEDKDPNSGLLPIIEAIGGGTGGIAGYAGARAGFKLGGASGAALGAVAIPIVAEAIAVAFNRIKETLDEATKSSLLFQRAIIGITGTFQATTNVTSSSGSPLSIQDQYKFQTKRARETLLAGRQKLLPLGIAGEQEAVLIQAIEVGAAQKGISLTSEEAATIAERIGGAIVAQRPELLSNPGLLRRDVEDVFSNSGAAARTVLGSIIRPQLGAFANSTSGEDYLKATAPLQAYGDAFKNSDLAVVQIQRLTSSLDNLKLALGNAINEFPPYVEGLKAINNFLQPKEENFFNRIAAYGYERGENIAKYFSKERESIVKPKPQIEINTLLTKSGIDPNEIIKNAKQLEQLPELNIRRLNKLNEFRNNQEYGTDINNLQVNELSRNRKIILQQKQSGLNTGFISDLLASDKLSLKENEEDISGLNDRKGLLQKELLRAKSNVRIDIQNQRNSTENGISGGPNFIASLEKFREIQSQIYENDRKINEGRAEGVRLLEGQVDKAKLLTDLAIARIANLGPSSGNQSKILNKVIEGIDNQINAESNLLGKGNDDEVFAKIGAFSARKQEFNQQKTIAGIDTKLSGINTLTFAGQLESGLLGINKQEASGAISSNVAKAQEKNFKEQSTLDFGQKLISLSEGAERARNALDKLPFSSANLDDALKENAAQFRELSKVQELSSLRGDDKAQAAARQFLEAGGTLSADQSFALAKRGITRPDFGPSLTDEFRKKDIARLNFDTVLSETDPDRVSSQNNVQFRNLIQSRKDIESNIRSQPTEKAKYELDLAQNTKNLNDLTGGSFSIQNLVPSLSGLGKGLTDLIPKIEQLISKLDPANQATATANAIDRTFKS